MRTYRLFTLIFLLIFQPLAQANLPDFTQMVRENSATVVNISTTNQQNNVTSENNKSLGTGFIISKDGYILTNRHVIQTADKIIVRLKNRQEFVAKLIGSDERTDTALLKISANNLSSIKIGIPENLEVGAWVIAIGSPFGFEQSVTAGIVSGKGRNLPSENYVPFIQTDVAINPGNSGGPLFNLAGEVIGINSQIYSNSGSYAGISFAIPINVIMNVVTQLKKTGKVSRGWMGVNTKDVSWDLANSYKMSRAYGALITAVIPASPAAKTNFAVGDIITHFNDEIIETASELSPKIGLMTTGEIVNIDIIRQGKNQTLELEIGLLPPKNSEIDNQQTIAQLDLTASNLTAADKEILDISQAGILIRSVQLGGIAFQAGIRAGDVILNIQNNLIQNFNDINRVLNTSPKLQTVTILVQRHGNRLFLPVKLF